MANRPGKGFRVELFSDRFDVECQPEPWASAQRLIESAGTLARAAPNSGSA